MNTQLSIAQVTKATYSVNSLIYWKLEYSYDMAVSHIVYVTNEKNKAKRTNIENIKLYTLHGVSINSIASVSRHFFFVTVDFELNAFW